MIDFAGQAQDEIMKRLERYDKLSEFLVYRDSSAAANGYDVLDASPENQWYQQGAREVLDDIRNILGWPKGDE